MTTARVKKRIRIVSVNYRYNDITLAVRASLQT